MPSLVVANGVSVRKKERKKGNMYMFNVIKILQRVIVTTCYSYIRNVLQWIRYESKWEEHVYFNGCWPWQFDLGSLWCMRWADGGYPCTCICARWWFPLLVSWGRALFGLGVAVLTLAVWPWQFEPWQFDFGWLRIHPDLDVCNHTWNGKTGRHVYTWLLHWTRASGTCSRCLGSIPKYGC